MKKIYTTLTLIFAISAFAIADSQEPDFPGLQGNERYMTLKETNTLLQQREDSIQNVIAKTREEFAQRNNTDSLTNEQIDIFTSQILNLEEQIFELRQQRGDVITELNNIEQEYILAHMFAPAPETETTEESIEETIVAPVEQRMLIHNDIFRRSLTEEDYAELESAQREDEQMVALCNDFQSLYTKFENTTRDYMETTSESVADSLFSVYHSLKREIAILNDAIDSQWAHIIDTKYYAYGYILEKGFRYDLLDNSSEQFSEMQQRCAEKDGLYVSDAIMHYAIGHPTLLDFEIAVAEDLGLQQAADSLHSAKRDFVAPNYRQEMVELERRLFIDYEPIIIGRTNYYTNSNPVPPLKVYERGTIYRILLGKFRSKQPMTLFKGVQPLFITTEEDLYCYYAGGYATLKEAEEAQLFLREKGFKKPEICRWRDGEMINIDTLEEEDTDNTTPLVGSRYIVMLECDTIDEALRQTITATSPDKVISRRGAQFAIGTFTDYAEATALLTALAEQHPDVSATIVELDL
ncbi:MAG: hypothetical protein IIV52_04840 [Alistipes sp.]|nr:hypothetical protein [Alistipes sp.]